MVKHVDADRTLAETLTLTITRTLTLFIHSVIHRQHFTGGRNHWVKRLVREVAGSNLNGIYSLYFSVSIDRCQVRVRVMIRRVAYFHTPAKFKTSTESEAVIGRALCDVGQ